IKIRNRHAPGFLDCLLPSGHRHVIKVTSPFIFRKVCNKKFTAPEFAVVSITQTIKCNTNYLVVNAIFCHTAYNMGVMMLYSYFNHIVSLRKGVFGGKVFWMQVVCYHLRFNGEKSFIMLDSRLIRIHGFGIFQFSYMMT